MSGALVHDPANRPVERLESHKFVAGYFCERKGGEINTSLKVCFQREAPLNEVKIPAAAVKIGGDTNIHIDVDFSHREACQRELGATEIAHEERLIDRNFREAAPGRPLEALGLRRVRRRHQRAYLQRRLVAPR